MHYITFNFLDQHQHGTAFHQFLKLRKRHFVDALRWSIPHDDEVEMDQYDNPKAWYSLVCKGGEVVGGARVMSTDVVWGEHTYMLHDALNGKLGEIPPAIVPHDITSPKVWEATRLVISDQLSTQVERGMSLRLIVKGLTEIAASQGATEMMSLSPLPLMRALRQIGYQARREGTPYKNDEDGRRYAVLMMPVTSPTEDVLDPEVVPKSLPQIPELAIS